MAVPCLNLTAEITGEIILQTEEESDCCPRGPTTLIRMVRDCKGFMLMFMDEPDDNVIFLNFYQRHSNTTRRRVFLKARRDAFLEAASSPSAIDLRKVAASVIFTNENDDGIIARAATRLTRVACATATFTANKRRIRSISRRGGISSSDTHTASRGPPRSSC